MYVKIEHENSTAGCVQSVILLKCSRKVRIRLPIYWKTLLFQIGQQAAYYFFEVFFLSLSLFHDTNTHLFLEFFSGRGGGVFLSLSKSCQVLCPFHSIVEIESGHKICSLQLRCSLLAQLQLVVSSV